MTDEQEIRDKLIAMNKAEIAKLKELIKYHKDIIKRLEDESII
jgi:hypothetical protein